MYKFHDIEKKWQNYWYSNKMFETKDDYSLKKVYNLVEFPYPSGAGMHIGHIKAYMGLEVISRKRRMEGYNVLFPIGFDAYGLPTENYAIKMGIHPRKVTDENIKIFTEQLLKTGFSFNYDRIIDTTDPKFYKWTQFIFLKMYEHGLVFRDKTYINYCPSCKVVLSNEDSQGGKCDRCESAVILKEKDVWFLRITAYADKLLEGLREVDYLPRIKTEQENWIGKSQGAYVNFKLSEVEDILKVYTTRPDTLFGATFMVIAPEHPIIEKFQDQISNIADIKKYQEQSKKKSEFERIQLVKEKTGVEIQGLTAINPVNNEEIAIYIADYVMMGYGTGAIMAVPAHDERDYEFAMKFSIPIKQVIAPSFKATGDSAPKEGVLNTTREIVNVVLKHQQTGKYLILDWENQGWKSFICGGIEANESISEAALREIKEETGYQNIVIDKISNFYFCDKFYAAHKNVNRDVKSHIVYAHITSDEKIAVSDEESKQHTPVWLSKDEVLNYVNKPTKECIEWFFDEEKAWMADGLMVNSEFLNGIETKQEAIEKMIAYLEDNNLGEATIQYKMKDWAFNRQRYWGEPIPIVHCPKCGIVPVPYAELPLILPETNNFKPGSDGESPLASIESWVNTTCPKCHEKAKRETDTMPQWAGSSWYYLRYIDPHNDNELASKENMNYWMNVDWYNGGMEHVSRHLIYSRFWHKFLYDISLVNTKEPYQKRTAQGLVLGSDGEKMSKSKGNIINPIDIIETYGADVLRTYILFMGDYGEEAPWNIDGVKGISRFLDRVFNLKERVIDHNGYTQELEVIINKTIKKVSEDIENMKYNTAIAELMKLLNEYLKITNITKDDYLVLIKLLYPFAPHITEEINSLYSNDSLVFTSWLKYDDTKLETETKELVVQVNGKVRGKTLININNNEDEIKNIALSLDNVKNHICDKEIVKIVVIQNKLVNIVVK